MEGAHHVNEAVLDQHVDDLPIAPDVGNRTHASLGRRPRRVGHVSDGLARHSWQFLQGTCTYYPPTSNDNAVVIRWLTRTYDRAKAMPRRQQSGCFFPYWEISRSAPPARTSRREIFRGQAVRSLDS